MTNAIVAHPPNDHPTSEARSSPSPSRTAETQSTQSRRSRSMAVCRDLPASPRISTANTRCSCDRGPTLSRHPVALVSVACSRTTGGASAGPLVKMWVSPKGVGTHTDWQGTGHSSVSYTHLRAHETVLDL